MREHAERILLALMAAMLAFGSTWLWNMRGELTGVQKSVNSSLILIEQIPGLHKEISKTQEELSYRRQIVERLPMYEDMFKQIAVQHAILTKDVATIREMAHGRFATLEKQIQAIWARARTHRSPQELYEEEGP